MELIPHSLKSGKIKTKLKITENSDVDLWLIKGKNQGKTLVLTTGMHACEYIGILAVREFFEEADENRFNGNVLILPLINKTGFYQGVKQIMPEDGKNLNRVFSDNEAKTYTEKLSKAIINNIYPLADFILDLHGGDINEAMENLVFYPARVDKETSEFSRKAAMTLPVRYRLASGASNGLYSFAANKKIPGLLLEIGEKGEHTRKNIDLCKESIYRILAYLDICGEKLVNEEQKQADLSFYEEAEYEGFWFPYVKAGEKVKKGSLLGELKGMDGECMQKICAKEDAVVWYYTYTLGVKKSDPLIAYGIPV